MSQVSPMAPIYGYWTPHLWSNLLSTLDNSILKTYTISTLSSVHPLQTQLFLRNIEIWIVPSVAAAAFQTVRF